MGEKWEDVGVSIIYRKRLVSEGQKELYPGILRPLPCLEHRLSLTQKRALYRHAHTCRRQQKAYVNERLHTHTHTYTHPCAQLYRHKAKTCTTTTKSSLSLVNWQVINFMMQNQNASDEDGEEKKSVMCNCAGPDPCKQLPPNPQETCVHVF